jgi:hypothetical protein
MAGPVPAMTIIEAQSSTGRDHRDKPGDDKHDDPIPQW